MATLKPTGAAAAANSGFPSVTKDLITTNFTNLIDFQATANTPFLPETIDKKVKRFGNRSISGLLSKMAAEFSLQSDKIIWAEDNRLHLKATGITRSVGSATAAQTFTFPTGHGFRVGQTVILAQGTGTASGIEGKGHIKSVSGTTVVIDSYKVATTASPFDGGFAGLGTANIIAIVYGSEFQKGVGGMAGSLETTYVDRENNPIILKDHFSVSGSDTAQIGWLEVRGVEGDSGHGYLWYLQSEMDNRARFMDYIEIALVEAVPAVSGSDADSAGYKGSKGLFYELDTYGNTFTGGFDDSTAKTGLADFDVILKQLDTQGNIEENTLYLNRNQSLVLDNVLGNQSDVTANGGGPSWGSFSNKKDMALDLGFSGWRRGSYDFYKTDWKYLNDVTGRGTLKGSATDATAAGQSIIQGIMCPMGSSSVYDQMLSKTVTRPYMHIRYRSSTVDNRKLKTWVTGSVGARTSAEDRMDIHYLSERCLVVQAANNFAIFRNK